MKVGGVYSFNGGEKIKSQLSEELQEIYAIINAVDADKHKNKISNEKTTRGKVFYKPSTLNKAFKREFTERHWADNTRLHCDYPTKYYTKDYSPASVAKNAYREIDFIKNRLGVEVQFGKYSFMVYNVCAKMTIFHNEGLIDMGIEIVPLRELALEMSSGVSYFEQFVWDLEHRGTADIDIPVLILGILP